MINVLVVEDERIVAEAHRLYVSRVRDFDVVGVVHSGAEALRFCQRNTVNLILLDFLLPDIHGLTVCHRLRAARCDADVIAVTGQNDVAAIKEAISLGVVRYIFKPFTADDMNKTLTRYVEFRKNFPPSGNIRSQAEVDAIWRARQDICILPLPKGIDRVTLQAITDALNKAPKGLTATMAATAIGVTRVTARNYLKHLEATGLAQRKPRFGRGRPEDWFSLTPTPPD